jgi:hypothetical protein
MSNGRHHSGAELATALGLQMLPVEGIWFRETWRGSAPQPGAPAAGTAIYGLITDDPQSFSAMHVLQTDEIWHFYSGDPLDLLLLYPDGTHTTVVLGPDVFAGHVPQVVVPAGVWMGADLVEGGRYCLFGTTMAPGFTPEQFLNGALDDLAATWPAAREHLTRLCRAGAPARMPDL